VAWYKPGCTIGGRGCAPRTVSDLTLPPPGFAKPGRTDLRQLSVPAWLYACPTQTAYTGASETSERTRGSRGSEDPDPVHR
jgi:hypothetical protein